MSEPVHDSGFLCVTDIHGIRHAIRLSSISGLRDADSNRTEAVIIVNGGRDAIIVAHEKDQLFAQIVGRNCACWPSPIDWRQVRPRYGALSFGRPVPGPLCVFH